MSVVGLEVDITNYSGRKDFQVTAEFVDKRHYTIQVRRLDSVKEGWTENIKVLANFYDMEKSSVIFIGPNKLSTTKFVGVETDFDIAKSATVEEPLEQYVIPVYPGAQQITRKMFNQVFNTDVVVLPTNLFAVGIKNGCVYTYNENYELLYQIELTIKNIVNVILSKGLFSEVYFIICADDGYMEYHYPSVRDQPKQIGETEFAGQKIVKLDDASAYAVLHSKKYILAQNTQVGTAFTAAMPDRYYFYLNRFNEYRSIHEGLPFSKKKAEIVYGSNPRGNKFIFTSRRDIDKSPREYFYSDAVSKTNVVAPKWIKRSDMVKYKYILDIDGNASTWDATAWKLNSGSVILKADSCWNQWFFDKFKAWTHYVPVKDDFSDLQEQFAWCEAHQAECEQMVRNCKKLFQEIYRYQTISNYVSNKLLEINNSVAYDISGRKLCFYNRLANTNPLININTISTTGGYLSTMRNICRKHFSSDVVVFIPNYRNIDVNPSFNATEFMQRYLSYGKKLVVASEKNLWPESLETLRYKIITSAPENCENKYLQSGVVCGEAGALLRLLEERVVDSSSEPNDQEYFSKAFVTERYDMTLDYGNKLVLNTYRCSQEEINAAIASGCQFINFNAGR